MQLPARDEVNVYAYAGGNPLSNVDPFGTIIVPIGTPADVSAINQALQNLSQVSPTAAALIRYLQNDPTDILVKTTKSGNSYHLHSSCSAGAVSYNPNLIILGAGDKAWKIRPPEVGLAHELIHAYHDIADTISSIRALEETNTVGLTGNSPYTENGIRNDYDLPRRPVY